MWKPQFTGQRGRRLLHLALTLTVVVALLAASLAFTAFAQAHNVFLDTTVEGRFTLRPRMVEILRAAEMRSDVDIIFCTDPDVLLSSYSSSLVYIMALELEKQVENIHVSTVNAAREPEAVAPYKRTSASEINSGHVIVTSGTEFRVYTMDSFFTVSSESGDVVGFNGEQKMCEAILSLTARDLPLACFTVGHGEVLPTQSDPETGYFFELIRDAGFTVTAIDLETEDIPPECGLLIINGPTEDFPSYAISDLENNTPLTKIDRFLDAYGSVFYFRDSAAPTLPNLEEFLAEWGIGFSVKDSAGTAFAGTTLTDSKAALSGLADRICGSYGTSSIYSDITSLASPPKTVFEKAAPVSILWRDNNSSVNSAGRKVEVLFSTTASAQALDAAGNTVTAGSFPLMTMTSETRVVDNAYFTSTLFVCGTTRYTAAEYLSENVYANREVLISAIRGAARTSVSVAEELEFKYYETTDFTESYDQSDNLVYLFDSEGNVVWETGADGESHAVILRILRPIEEWEKTLWVWVLCILPVVLLAGGGAFVCLRRRNR